MLLLGTLHGPRHSFRIFTSFVVKLHVALKIIIQVCCNIFHSFLAVQEGGKKIIEELTLKNKFLEKQRNELLQVGKSYRHLLLVGGKRSPVSDWLLLVKGFKKQMDLIDVLKRQKLHLEAAHVLR
jgi:hypothetical protein